MKQAANVFKVALVVVLIVGYFVYVQHDRLRRSKLRFTPEAAVVMKGRCAAAKPLQ